MQSQYATLPFKDIITFIYVFIIACVCVIIHMSLHTYRGQRTTYGCQFFPSTLWVLEIILEALAADEFTPENIEYWLLGWSVFLFVFYFVFVFTNLTKASVTWEEEPQMRKCLHLIAL